MNFWKLLLLIAIPIGVMFGLSIINLFADSEVVRFVEQFVIAGVVASGIVYRFFM